MKCFVACRSSLKHCFETLSLSMVAGKIDHLEPHFTSYQEHHFLGPEGLPGTGLSALVMVETSASLKGVTWCGQERGGPMRLVPVDAVPGETGAGGGGMCMTEGCAVLLQR